MSVFVLDRSGQPLMPCSEKRARKLLESGRARVHRLVPFVIRLIDRKQSESVLQPVRIKLDPGSKTTGLALVRDVEDVCAMTGEIQRAAAVLSLVDIVHRGRVAVRASGSFNIQTATAVVQGIGHKHCHLIQRNDGYGYFFNRTAHSKREQAAVQAKGAFGASRSASPT